MTQERCLLPVLTLPGQRPPANDSRMTPEAFFIDLNPLVGYTYPSFWTTEDSELADGVVFLKRKENVS
jgi:hypothetical protein